MRPFEDIEKFVRRGKVNVKTGEQMDKQTLDDSYAVIDETIESPSKGYKSRMNRIAVQNRITKLLAAAAIIIIAISLFLGRDRSVPKIPTTKPQEAAQPDTRMISMMSLRLSYQRGGIDALDEQFRDTLNMLGPQLPNLSMRDLLEGVNGY